MLWQQFKGGEGGFITNKTLKLWYLKPNIIYIPSTPHCSTCPFWFKPPFPPQQRPSPSGHRRHHPQQIAGEAGAREALWLEPSVLLALRNNRPDVILRGVVCPLTYDTKVGKHKVSRLQHPVVWGSLWASGRSCSSFAHLYLQLANSQSLCFLFLFLSNSIIFCVLCTAW